jgi:hypothetical protein
MRKALFALGLVTGIVYLVVGIVAGAWPSHWDTASTSDRVLWIVFLAGGGLVVLAGLRRIERSPLAGAVLVSLGAVAGALPLFWTILAPLAAIALIVLSVRYARRPVAAPAP